MILLSSNFILDVEFDGNIETLIESIENGEAIQYNNIAFPIKGIVSVGKQLIIPLPHKNIVIDLSSAFEVLKKAPKTRITMNIQK